MVTANASSLRCASRNPAPSRNSPACFHINPRMSAIHLSVAASGVTPAAASGTAVEFAASRRNLRDHRLRRQRSKHQPLQQRITRQPVRPMHSCTCRLSGPIQPRQRGPSLHIRLHSAHQVMRRGPHRNQIPPQLHPDTPPETSRSPETAPSNPLPLFAATCRMSRYTSPSIPSRVIARATTSRGASSSSG